MNKELKILIIFIACVFAWMIFSEYVQMNIYLNVIGNLCFIISYVIHDKVHLKNKEDKQ